MGREVHYLGEADLSALLERLGCETIRGTVRGEEHTTYETLERGRLGEVALGVAPPVESVKGFLFPARERVAVYPAAAGGEGAAEGFVEQAVVGARACDVAALGILDKIFLEGETVDPFYEERRQKTMLVTTDCVEPGEYCFCTLVGGRPWAEVGFDINFSPIDGGYLVEAGSERGEAVLEGAGSLLRRAGAEQLAQRDRLREEAVRVLKEQNREFEPVGEAPVDKEAAIGKVVAEASHCVECGACSYICPTCHCFLLFDQRGSGEGKRFERQKVWDSCVMSNFAKMAGVGGFKPTPRPALRDRFENRIRHKLEWMVENLNVIGCVGCGRCEAACMGGSDIRQAIKELGL